MNDLPPLEQREPAARWPLAARLAALRPHLPKVVTGVAVVLAVIGVLMIQRQGVLRNQPPALPTDSHALEQALPAGAAPDTRPLKSEPGTLVLDDFRLVVPGTWERKKELEDEGPGTKLFLVGPVLANVNLIIGLDVYPLSEGMTLEAFAQQYTKPWQNKPALATSEATLCREAAKMVSFTESGLDKVFLLMVWRSKGYVVGMISPVGQKQRALNEFRKVLDSFQVYE